MNKLPIAILIPHAGLEVPPELADRVALSAAQIFNEADANIDQIFDFQDCVMHWVRFPYARALVDVNRPADPTLTRPGDGIVKWQTSYGSAVYPPGRQPDVALARQLVNRYWQPWHERLAAIAADGEVKLVIDAHSMAAIGPKEYDDPNALRPRLSVSNLGNDQGELRAAGSPYLSAPAAVARELARLLGELVADVEPMAEVGAAVSLNSPFFGGWDLVQHAPGARQPWLMIEVNRGLYVGAQHGEMPLLLPDLEKIALLREKMWCGLSNFYKNL